MSRWSASMFVTTATVGVRARKDRSYSSASTTNSLSEPNLRFPPHDPTRPPTTPVGSRPAAASASVVITVVVVFPCVPAMATRSPPIDVVRGGARDGHESYLHDGGGACGYRWRS